MAITKKQLENLKAQLISLGDDLYELLYLDFENTEFMKNMQTTLSEKHEVILKELGVQLFLDKSLEERLNCIGGIDGTGRERLNMGKNINLCLNLNEEVLDKLDIDILQNKFDHMVVFVKYFKHYDQLMQVNELKKDSKLDLKKLYEIDKALKNLEPRKLVEVFVKCSDTNMPKQYFIQGMKNYFFLGKILSNDTKTYNSNDLKHFVHATEKLYDVFSKIPNIDKDYIKNEIIIPENKPLSLEIQSLLESSGAYKAAEEFKQSIKELMNEAAKTVDSIQKQTFVQMVENSKANTQIGPDAS